ncbi:uncharacterized protein [Physcomitrium patens]|uniref:Tify domain-containing protein n=1 Tax=Physcomitrium patens TaxID=3218 RepID=A0A2K1KGV1_PHYPA|nr:protein TIFY 6a-like [Physcomitrium patens]XP_024378253.1 protein TIFY 6a-like [Physcomitrium patens]XP_024378254.1 protein TIFY 6a-like [Physcomitrium patens]PNR53012.1 hypothetical protein PHYPA_009387 [Physcomitrium patens]|eukprot:XP_024378251.1 protein TIFY 6a-like [Physcomitrella patens]
MVDWRAMAREPVAVDYMGVGGAPSSISGGHEERVSLVRPIPSVPNNGGGHFRRSPAPEGGPHSSPFEQHDPDQKSWKRASFLARFQSEEDNSRRVIICPNKERESTDGHLNDHPQSSSQWNNSESKSHTHHPQSQKVAAMYASHHHLLRGIQNGDAWTSPLKDEVQRGAQPLDHAMQPHLSSNQGRFESPMPFGGHRLGSVESGAAVARKKPPFQYPFQAGNLPRPGGPCKQPRTAQLTIFYAGMVNLYDDVPVDKAQAIMLFAGSESTWSSNLMDPPQAGSVASGRTFSAPTTVPLSTPGPPAPQALTTSASGPPSSVLPGMVFSNLRQPSTTNVELPQARKASLARFLEKRKDRVKKDPVKEGDATPFGNSPDPSIGKPPTWSPSPSPSVSRCMDHGSSPGRLEHQSGTSSGNEQNSPCNSRPPQSPPSQGVAE